MTLKITPFYSNPDDIIKEAEENNPNFKPTDHQGKEGEAELYRLLKKQLPYDWMVLYGVSIFGGEERQIDFLVIVPEIGIINLECKNFEGAKIENRGSSFVLKCGERINPLEQSIGAVRLFWDNAKKQFFDDQYWGIFTRAVIFPLLDFIDEDGDCIDFGENPIYTKKDCGRLEEIIRDLLEKARKDLRQKLGGKDPTLLSRYNAEFLYNKYKIQGTSCVAFTNPDVATNQKVLDALLQDRQSDILKKIFPTDGSKHVIPKYIHIEGAAGTGKTWLAMAIAGKFLAQKKCVLYVCFNKALAFFHSRGQDESRTDFHIQHFDALDKLCFGICIKHDYTKKQLAGEPEAMTGFEREMLKKIEFVKPKFRPDVILIDEAQDFSKAKINFLGKLWTGSGTIIYFSDPNQRIYQNDDIMACVDEKQHPEKYTLTKNLRNTKAIFKKCQELINDKGNLIPTEEPIPVGIPNIERTLSMEQALMEIADLLKEYPWSNVAILTLTNDLLSQINIPQVTFNSLEEATSEDGSSQKTKITPKTINRWKNNKTCWRSTVHAFKGLEAPCIIMLIPSGLKLTNEDFLQYIGASRAQYRLVIYTITG